MAPADYFLHTPLPCTVEELLVFPVRAAPDAALAALRATLEREGYRVRAGDTYDLVGRRGLERVFVGIGPHPKGLAARVKCKALVPGRTSKLLDHVNALVAERLGVAIERTEVPGGNTL